jgi:hypothetical protein
LIEAAMVRHPLGCQVIGAYTNMLEMSSFYGFEKIEDDRQLPLERKALEGRE